MTRARRASPWCLLASAAPALAACAPSRPPPPPSPVSPAEWRAVRAALVDLRAAVAPTEPRTYRVATTLREGRTGRVVAARGGLAVSPPGALRMQLVGPAGATMLDVWIRGDRDRFAVPAMDLVERAGAADPRPGRPVSFLRWWMLAPLEGKLLFAERSGAGYHAVLRAPDGAHVDVWLADGGRRVEAHRRTRVDDEHVVAEDPPCGTARYESRVGRLSVEVSCEGMVGTPPPRAFDDPDAPR